MTRRRAQAKAAALTAAGTLTRVVRHRRNGRIEYYTLSRAKERVKQNRYRRSAKGRAMIARYERSPKSRARYARYRQTVKRRAAVSRHLGILNDEGKPITAADIDALWREFKGKCFVCGTRLRRRGRRGRHIDHCHTTRRVRAPLCRTDNLIEGMLKQLGIRTPDQLMHWAWRMVTLRMLPEIRHNTTK
jgi:hypothetical protein